MSREGRTVAIIQARLGSTRLPGKALADICGRSMLDRVVLRLRAARSIHSIAIATTMLGEDDSIVEAANRLGEICIRGSENDVLGRYADAAEATRADVVVRIGSDSPLIDPDVVDLVVSSFRSALPSVDCATNTVVRTFPHGLNTEVLSRDALLRAAAGATEPHQREHVTPFLYENPDRFRVLHVRGQSDLSSLRWTVDTAEDLTFVREVYARLDSEADFSWRDVVSLLESHPDLGEINAHVRQRLARSEAN